MTHSEVGLHLLQEGVEGTAPWPFFWFSFVVWCIGLVVPLYPLSSLHSCLYLLELLPHLSITIYENVNNNVSYI